GDVSVWQPAFGAEETPHLFSRRFGLFSSRGYLRVHLQSRQSGRVELAPQFSRARYENLIEADTTHTKRGQHSPGIPVPFPNSPVVADCKCFLRPTAHGSISSTSRLFPRRSHARELSIPANQPFISGYPDAALGVFGESAHVLAGQPVSS